MVGVVVFSMKKWVGLGVSNCKKIGLVLGIGCFGIVILGCGVFHEKIELGLGFGCQIVKRIGLVLWLGVLVNLNWGWGWGLLSMV